MLSSSSSSQRRPSSSLPKKQPQQQQQQHRNDAHGPSAAGRAVRQRALRCGCLATVFAVCQWATQQLQSSLLVMPHHPGGCLPSSVRLLTAMGGGGPPSPEEFFGMSSWLSQSNNGGSQQFVRRRGIGGSGSNKISSLSNTILAGDVATSSRPSFILYVGVPEHSTELQCQICSNPRLIDALERDGYVFLGACHKHDCDAFPSSSASASAEAAAAASTAAVAPEPTNSTNSNATLGGGHKILTPKASNYFFWTSGVYELSSANTTLGIVPHTLPMSLAHGRRRNIPQLEVEFMLQLDAVRQSGQNAILIHPGASVWSAKHIRTLSAFLNLHWDVHVLVGPYQPLLEYLSEISYSFVQSQYVESRTYKLWPGQKRDGRVGFDSLEQSTINDVKQLIEENLVHGVHPMEMVRSNYARHFGPNRTHYVIPSLPDRGTAKDKVDKARPVSDDMQDHLLDHVMCDMLGFARSCRVVKGLRRPPPKPPTSGGQWTRRLAEIWERIQVDAMAVAAHDRHVDRTNNDNIHHSNESLPVAWTRSSVRNEIVSRLEQLGQSPRADWPLMCMDAEPTEALTEYSRVLHDRILMRDRASRGGEDNDKRNQTTATVAYAAGMESFVTDVLLCYVDTDVILNDEHGPWATWFRDLVPDRRGNSADATGDPIVAEEEEVGLEVTPMEAQ
jgi:hypothetical protein